MNPATNSNRGIYDSRYQSLEDHEMMRLKPPKKKDREGNRAAIILISDMKGKRYRFH